MIFLGRFSPEPIFKGSQIAEGAFSCLRDPDATVSSVSLLSRPAGHSVVSNNVDIKIFMLILTFRYISLLLYTMHSSDPNSMRTGTLRDALVSIIARARRATFEELQPSTTRPRPRAFRSAGERF